MDENTISVEELLNSQRQTSDTATVEEISEDDASVKVAPHLRSNRCACAYALNVPKESIESLVKTGEMHDCCGQSLHVVGITFRDSILTSVFRQLAARAKSTDIDFPASDISKVFRGQLTNLRSRRVPRSPDEWQHDCLEDANARYDQCQMDAQDDFDRCVCYNLLQADLAACGRHSGRLMACPPPGFSGGRISGFMRGSRRPDAKEYIL